MHREAGNTMKYRGFIITPCYTVGSTFKITADGRVINRRPTRSDIEYYEIIDPLENDSRHGAEDTIPLCKERIDRLLNTLGMKSNTPSP